MKVLAADVIQAPAKIEQDILGSEAEIIVAQATKNSDIDDETWKSCDAILAYDQLTYKKETLAKLDNCKIIVRVGVGFDNVDLDYAKEKGIIVCNIPDYGTEEVADHTIALLLTLTRGLTKYSKNVEKRNWDRANALPIRLRGKTLGIIGLGRIGTATAMRAKAFGLDIVFYDPYVCDGQHKALGITRVESLEELAKKSQFISIHTPVNEETAEILNEKFFKHVQKGTYLINTARGGLMNINDLYNAMKDGTIKACGLDVLPIEPNDDSQKLIVALENQEEWIKDRLIVTPHVAFFSPEGYIEMRTNAALEVKRALGNQAVRNQVNK